jgi:hypothetical protein
MELWKARMYNMSNFYINIYDNTTNKTWCEEFDSYYLFKKRVNKLKYSKKLFIISRSNLLD